MRLFRGHSLLSFVCGCFALVLGLLVLLGWVTHTVALVRLNGHVMAMVSSTALCLVLGGLALVAARWPDTLARRVSLGAGLLLTAISAAMMTQVLWRVDLGVNMAPFHAWVGDASPFPGQMAPNTALAFLLLGVGLLLEALAPPSPWLIRIRLCMAWLAAILGLTGLLVYLVRPELLFGWYAGVVRMAPNTATGVLILGLGYGSRWQMQAERPDDLEWHRRGIFHTAALTLTVVALLTGAAGFALQLNSVTQGAEDRLSMTLGDRRLLLEEALASAEQKVALTSTNPLVVAQMSAWHKQVAGSRQAPRQGLTALADSLLPHGFTYVAFEGPDHQRVDAGHAIGEPPAQVKLQGLPSATLVWEDGYVVRHRSPVVDGGEIVGHLLTEQPVKVLALLASEVARWGESYDMALCTTAADAAKIQCFPQRLNPAWFSAPKMAKGQPLPMALALDGQTGVTTRLDFRLKQVVAAYAPVGNTGLGMVLKVDTMELYAPARQQLLMALPVVALVVLAGLWTLWMRLRPIVQALVLARETARANEARFIAAMESSLDAFYILRGERDAAGQLVDFRFTYVTARGADLVSMLPSQVEGQLLCELLPINRTGGFFDKYKQVLESGIPLAEEFSVDQPGVVATWISHQIVKLGDDCIAITSRDVSERKQTEEAVLRSEERLRLVTDNVPALISNIDREHRFRFANLAYKDWLGVEPANLIGCSLRELYGEMAYARIKPYLERALGGETLSYERELDTPGGLRHVHATMTPHRNSAGEIVGLYVLMNDITALKKAKKQSALSEERLSLALEGSHLALFDWNLTTNLVYHSAHWSGMLGGPLVETTTTLDSLGQLVHPDDRGFVREKVAASIKGVVPFYVAEHRVRTGNGDWIWILSRGRVVERDAQGRALRLSGTNSDITDQKRIEAQLHRMAKIDSLTDLPNRALFQDRLNGALNRLRRQGSAMALMLLDIDFFKSINDSLGHDAGDAVLQEFALRLTRSVRQTDTVARLGGDEFTIILEALHTADEAEMIAAKIVASMAEPFTHAGRPLKVGASIGVAYLAQPDEDAARLIKRADQALYRAKAAGRNTFRRAEPAAA